MKILLLNDTADEANPGCRGTQRGLRRLLSGVGGEIVRSVKVHFGRERFEQALRPRRRGILGRVRSLAGIVTPDDIGGAFEADVGKWEACARDWESELASLFENVELIVLNGEGTLHHDRPSALALLAIARTGQNRNIPVWILNATFQDMSPDLLMPILESAQHVAVREPRSLKWLEERGHSGAVQASDCLFQLADLASSESKDVKACLYTPGVLGGVPEPLGLSDTLVSSHVAALREAGYEPVWLKVAPNDDRLADTAAKLKVEVRSVEAAEPEAVFDLLGSFSLVVSGRFHITIFSWLSGIPTICLESNTWKTTGLLEANGCPLDPARSRADLDKWLADGGFLPTPESLQRSVEWSHCNVPANLCVE